MVRRINYIVAVIAALIGLMSLPAAAQSGRTFYIDYAGGSNGNSGTSSSSPWKSHPYMQSSGGCTGTGNAPSYSHQAGDRFIFKGGVTWPAACFQMTIAGSGSSSGSPDVYTVDQTWYAGSSFVKPAFNLNGSTTSNGTNVILVNASNVTIDNVEIKGQLVSGNANMSCSLASINLSSSSNVTVSNSLVHDWIASAGATTQAGGDHDTGSICGGNNSLVDHTEVHDANGRVGSTAVAFGACFRNIATVSYSICHHVGDGINGYGQVNDSQFYNITNAETAFYTTLHTNVIQQTWPGGTGSVYNNLIYDNNPIGQVIGMCPTTNFYNNVMWNNGPGGGADILVDTGVNACTVNTGTVANVYNNTVDCSNGVSCLRVTRSGQTVGTVNVENNHWITNSGPTSFEATITALKQSNNVSMTTSTASSQGFTSANRYAPTSSSNATVNAAATLSGICAGPLTSLCADILHTSRAASWDSGAYKFGGSTQTTKPNPPSGLVAVVQ